MYLRRLSTECRSILSADMATDTRPIYQPTLGRYVGQDSVACRPTPGRYFTDTRPPLGRYFTNTRPTLSSLGQLLLPPEFYLPCSTERGFQWPSSFFGLQLRQYSCLFPAMFFPCHRFYIRPSLLLDAAAFGDCCFWRLVILGKQKII